MAGNPNSQRRWLTQTWNGLSAEEKQQIPLETFIEMGMQKIDSNQPVTGDFGQYHVESSPLEFVGGGVPGSRIGSISDFWLGPENPLTFKEPNAGMGMGWKDATSGNQVNFRREVSPYMMYQNPNDPTMWDEIPDPATPMHRTFTEAEQGAWEGAYKKDRSEDVTRQALGNELRRKDLSKYMSLRQSGMLEQLLDALMQQQSGG